MELCTELVACHGLVVRKEKLEVLAFFCCVVFCCHCWVLVLSLLLEVLRFSYKMTQILFHNI